MKKSTIRYSDRAWQLLEETSQRTGRPITALVNEAIESHFGISSPPDKLAALEEAIEALADRLEAVEAAIRLSATQDRA